MKTTLYIGAPKPIQIETPKSIKLNLLSGGGADIHTCFYDIDECMKWLEERAAQERKLEETMKAEDEKDDSEELQEWLRGRGTISPAHAGLIRRPCSYCGTREAAVNERLCEVCLTEIGEEPKTVMDQLREHLRCSNANQHITGCSFYALPNERFCGWCKNHAHEWLGRTKVQNGGPTPNPKFRQISSATRTCALSRNCSGEMEAWVRKEPLSIQESKLVPILWWYCKTCHAQRVAMHTGAVRDPHVEPMLDEASENESIASTLEHYSEAREMGERVQNLIEKPN